MVKKIISGGQTGADRAALDVAIEAGIPHGGWVPRGRKTENGILPSKYHLKETATLNYSERTQKNILNADGILILSHGELGGGSAFTRDFAKARSRPCMHIDLTEIKDAEAVAIIQTWLSENSILTLNVAGPRSTEDPCIYTHTQTILGALLRLNLM